MSNGWHDLDFPWSGRCNVRKFHGVVQTINHHNLRVQILVWMDAGTKNQALVKITLVTELDHDAMRRRWMIDHVLYHAGNINIRVILVIRSGRMQVSLVDLGSLRLRVPCHCRRIPVFGHSLYRPAIIRSIGWMILKTQS